MINNSNLNHLNETISSQEYTIMIDKVGDIRLGF